jgi:hypothetical protein
VGAMGRILKRKEVKEKENQFRIIF